MFEKSTQFKNWCYYGRESELQKIKDHKETTYKKACHKIQTFNPQANFPGLGLEDETKYLNFYVQQYLEICADNKEPLRVEAAAIAYFKRFFLKHVIQTKDEPKDYFYPCLYLAIKNEEIPFNDLKHDYADLYNDTKFSEFPDRELQILKRLDFDIKIHSIYLPFEALIEQFNSDQTIYSKKQECMNLLRNCHYDDLIFEYPSGLLSLAAFLYVMKKYDIDVSNNSTFNKIIQIPQDIVPKLEGLLEKLKIFEKKKVSTEEVRRIRKRYEAFEKANNYKDDFVKPPEKQVHVNPAVERAIVEEK